MGIWQVWIDTGGTFTDCLARDPGGQLRRAKVLSSSALRATVRSATEKRGQVTLTFDAAFAPPEDFAVGSELSWLSQPEMAWPVTGSRPGELDVSLDAVQGVDRVGEAFELRFDEEAPILAARMVTGAAHRESLPPMMMRLATTRGTNALLERRGARTAIFLTEGFADLLVIGDQRRPDLFALEIHRPEPLYARVIEVPARAAADGSVLKPLDVEAFDGILRETAAEFESAAIALMHSYQRPLEEDAIEQRLVEHGLRHVSASASLSPTEGYLSRARTAVVDAYLQPVIGRYLERISSVVGPSRLRVMTSAGGLVGAASYRAKDSLLSGPAGGVVGAATAGQRLGFDRLIAFDMGGTSTDVSRFSGDFEYRFEQKVGDASVAAPALAIETVAAGGGSICRLDGAQLKVGPESAGAAPGPACYGAGGPLTLTDVNLLLGRLDEERFQIPVNRQAAARIAETQAAELGSLTKDEVLQGYVAIANQRMADAVRQISVRRGYDPRDHALIAFGGAGGQHAAAVAEQIGIETVILPPDAGILSAFGLGAAVLERFATRQVLGLLGEVEDRLTDWLSTLAREAREALAAEGVEPGDMETRRRLLFLRLEGQESSLEIEAPGSLSTAEISRAFYGAYKVRYGYHPSDRQIEVESLRVVVSERADEPSRPTEQFHGLAEPSGRRQVFFNGAWREAALYWLPDVEDGQSFESPALIFDLHGSLTLPPGWEAERRGGAVVARRVPSES